MRSPVKKTTEILPAFYYAPSEKNIVRSFLNLLVSHITAQKNAERLHVFDKSSVMGENFPLFESLFEKDAAITFLKSTSPTKNLESHLQDSLPLVSSIRLPRLRELAAGLYRWNGTVLNRIRESMERVGIQRTLFDVGIHLKSSVFVSMKQYVDQIRKYQTMTAKKSLSIFVMTDSYESLEAFRKAADPAWKIFSFCPKDGKHLSLSEVKALTVEKRRDWLDLLLTELFVMQHTPYVVLNLTTSIGQFLFLTTRSQFPSESIVSLDAPTWSPSLLFKK